jgi:hypothetical protein
MINPAREGFSARLCAIDRCQIWLLRALALRYPDRLYLKGGLAMRALFGSVRLTKDIDFERAPSLSNDSLTKALPRELAGAALGAGLLEPKASVGKATRTTVRVALAARLPPRSEPVHFEVEISGRALPPAHHLQRAPVTPPAAYRIARFEVTCFDRHAMADAKVAALHADNRSVPRDIFDLDHLIAQGADPVDLLAVRGRRWLEAVAGRTIERTAAISWQRAETELVPYLPAGVRATLDAQAWDATCVRVTTAVDAWLGSAQ